MYFVDWFKVFVKSMQKLVHIVYATDESYLMPTLVALSSAVKFARYPDILVFHILDTGISNMKWQQFECRAKVLIEQGARIVRHIVDMSKYNEFPRWYGSLGIYARLEIPNILSDLEMCIYADGDTLFLNDPQILMTYYNPQFAIQGHKDWLIKKEGRSVQEVWFNKQGLEWCEDQYCNAGLILMNLSWFRSQGAVKKCYDFVKTYPSAPYREQDALAYVCRGRIGFLPDEWGWFSWNAFRMEKFGCMHFAYDIPSKLMANHYVDYNDAHKMWFDCAYEMLGLKLRDVLNPPMRYDVFARKLFFRCIFKILRELVRCGLIPYKPLKEYCIRHYR